MTINYDSILAKIKPVAEKKAAEISDDWGHGNLGGGFAGPMTPSRSRRMPPSPQYSAAKFISVLRKAILATAGSSYAAGGIDPTVAQEIADSLTAGKVYRDGSKWCVDISFDMYKHRASVRPDKYMDGISNIVALLNNGYDANQSIWGYWHPHGEIKTLAHRDGAGFVHIAVDEYMSDHAAKDAVEEIRVSSEYR